MQMSSKIARPTKVWKLVVVQNGDPLFCMPGGACSKPLFLLNLADYDPNTFLWLHRTPSPVQLQYLYLYHLTTDYNLFSPRNPCRLNDAAESFSIRYTGDATIRRGRKCMIGMSFQEFSYQEYKRWPTSTASSEPTTHTSKSYGL